MPTKLAPKLDRNILVPFLGSTADRVKDIAQLNGMHTTVVIRLLVDRGLESIEKGTPLTLTVPSWKNGQ